MALVHTTYLDGPLERSRLSQRELLARIFPQQESTEDELDHPSDSGSDSEVEQQGEEFVLVLSGVLCVCVEVVRCCSVPGLFINCGVSSDESAPVTTVFVNCIETNIWTD